MIATWMLYALGLAAAVSVVALAAEYTLRLYGRSTRWLWATSLVAALALPLLAWFLTPPPARTPLAGLGDIVPATAAPSSLPVAPAPPPSAWARVRAVEARLDGGLPWLWLGSSLLAALALALSYARLRGQRRRWTEDEVDGITVLVSDGVGPAVVGLRRGRIVVPSWVLQESEARRRLILAHENEHLAAGDARLLTGALAALVAAPWNPLVWWQIRRLRLAAEVDCDARVLRRGADRRGYAGLLLDVGMRFGEGGALAAFAEPRSLLARRLRALTAPLPRRRGWRAAAVAAAGASVVALACIAPRPDKPLPTDPVGPVQSVLADTSSPHFTPYTVAPELTNREEVRRLLIAAYPPLLKQAGIGGQILVWEHVDRTGQVVSARVDRGSGQAPLDSAAVYVARQMKFTPARNGSSPVEVWIKLPIIFLTKGGSEQAPGSPEDSAAAVAAGIALRPPAGVRTVLPKGVMPPELIAREELRAAFTANYPPALKAAGIGGTTWLRLHIDERGIATAAPVVGSSGRPELDAAAAKIGLTMRFVPARDTAAGKPVPVDVVVPIVFKTSADAAPTTPAVLSPSWRRSQPAGPFTRSSSAPAAAPAAQQDTFDVAPKLVNAAELRTLTADFADDVSLAIVRIHVDEKGLVSDAAIRKRSGSDERDRKLLAAARAMQFSPALRGGKPVATWLEFGMGRNRFAIGASIAPQPTVAPTPAQIRQGPTFTPYTVAPELLNREEVRGALIREYPPDLKAAGVSGTIQIWLLLDANGTPLQSRVKSSSGQPAFDSAAVRVGYMMRFTPAQNVGKNVEAWIGLPIIFKTVHSSPPERAPDTARGASGARAAAAAGVAARKPAVAALPAAWFVPVLGRH